MVRASIIEKVRTDLPGVGLDRIRRVLESAEVHGSNRRAISRETGLDSYLVQKILRIAGIRTLHPHHSVNEEALRRLYAQGLSDHDIAGHLSVPGSAITTKRQRLGLRANKAERWPQLAVGTRQADGYLEIASDRDAHGRYEAICHCSIEKEPHTAGKRVYVGHFNAHSVKSCGRDKATLFASSEYAQNRKAASEAYKRRRSDIMHGLSFQSLVVLTLCERGLKGAFRMNDRALLRGKEIDVVFPRLGMPKVLIEINEANHECTSHRKRDYMKRSFAKLLHPTAEWITITERGFLENPDAEMAKVLSSLERQGLLKKSLVD